MKVLRHNGAASFPKKPVPISSAGQVLLADLYGKLKTKCGGEFVNLVVVAVSEQAKEMGIIVWGRDESRICLWEGDAGLPGTAI